MESSMEKIRTIYSGMNGESHWVKEWGVSQIRFAEKFEKGFRFEHPADCYGDIGAASGPVMIGLGLTGIRKKYISGPVLVYTSSDRGDRAAAIFEFV
jgi:3-oxoacyl-[acyl-carrier-protein] synthase-1